MEALNQLWQTVQNFFVNYGVQFASLILVATLHGYGAAWLAVRMLFRPRHPVKLLGIKIFPQGMIPRHRDRLATAIGKAVGEELVSQETIIDELFGKDFLRRKIQNVVDAYTEDLLAQEYPSLIEALPANIREPVLDAIAMLQLKIAEHIQSVLQSEESIEAIQSFIERRVDDALSQRVSQVVDEENFNKVLSFLEDRIRSIVNEPTFEQKVRDFISRRIDDLVHVETPLGRLFTDDAVLLLKEKAGEQIDPIVHHLTEIAAAERTRNQISSLIKREVHEYYENLPFLKKIFVSRENILRDVDELVNEKVPKRIEETLRGDFFAQEARSFLDRTIDTAMGRPLPELMGKIAPEQLDRLKAQATRSVLAVLQGEEMMHSISAYLSDTLHKLRPHSIDAILETVHPQSESKLKKVLAKGLLNVLSREETTKAINAVLSNQIERVLAQPIGRLSDHIPEEKVRKAGKNLTETILTAAREKLPEAIREFDVGGVVREKINNYPVEKLESLILSVAKEHLRTIELFGAFFGFIIGFVQAILSYWFFGR